MLLGEDDEPEEGIVRLLRIAGLGPGFLADAGDGVGAEGGEVAGGVGEGTAEAHGAGAALFDGGIVEVGVGAAADDLVGHGGGLDRIDGVQAHLAFFDAGEHILEAVHVHGLVEAVVAGLAHEGVVGEGEGGVEVLLAPDLGGEDGGHEVVATQALEEGGHALAVALAGDGEGARGVPAPARGEQGDIEDRLLHEHGGVAGIHPGEGIGDGPGVLGTGGEEDGVVVRRGLEFEVEGGAELLAEGQSPGAVDARAEGGVDDELHPSRVIEEAFEDHVGIGGDDTEAVARGANVVDHLAGAVLDKAALLLEAGGEGFGIVEAVCDLAAEAACFLGELNGAAGGFAQPEGDGGGRAVGIDHTDGALLDAADTPRGGAKEKDVAGGALHGEVLVDGADGDVLGFGDDAVVTHLGDDAAVVEGGEAGSPPAADDAVDAVAVDEGRGGTGAIADAGGKHRHDLVEGLALEVREGGCFAHEVVEGVLGPGFAGGFGHDLLGEDVEGGGQGRDAVEASGADGANEGGALQELVAGGGEEAPVGAQTEGVAGAADALEQGGDAAGRADLADEIDGADVDAELEGGGGDEGAQVAGLEALLDAQAAFLGDAAMVARDGLLSKTLGQLLGDALGKGAGVDEYEGRVVLAHELSEAIVDVSKLLPGGDGLEVAGWGLDVELDVALVATVNDGGCARRPGEEAGDQLDGALGGGEADADGRGFGQTVEARKGEGEVAPAAVAGEGVNLVDDDGADAAQVLAAALGGDEEEERLGGGDEDVGGLAHHALAGGGGRVAGANRAGDGRQVVAHLCRERAYLGERLLEVALDIVAERLEGRDVDDAGGLFEVAGLGLADELVDAYEEGGKRLAGAGGGRDEGGLAGVDAGPALSLGIGGIRETALEPGAHDGVEGRERIPEGPGGSGYGVTLEHPCG